MTYLEHRQKIAEELASIDWPLWYTYDKEEKETIMHSPSYTRYAELVLKHKAEAYEKGAKGILGILHPEDIETASPYIGRELKSLALIP